MKSTRTRKVARVVCIRAALLLLVSGGTACEECHEDVPFEASRALPFTTRSALPDAGAARASSETWIATGDTDGRSLDEWLAMPCAEICGRLVAELHDADDATLTSCTAPIRTSYTYTVTCHYTATWCSSGGCNGQGG